MSLTLVLLLHCTHIGLQGIAGLAQHAHGHEGASTLLCQLFNHRASARLGLHRPAAALDDALASIRVKKKFARGYLRAATCYMKMGQLGQAAAVLDKVGLALLRFRVLSVRVGGLSGC